MDPVPNMATDAAVKSSSEDNQDALNAVVAAGSDSGPTAEESEKTYPPLMKLSVITLGLALAVFLYGLVSLFLFPTSAPRANSTSP